MNKPNRWKGFVLGGLGGAVGTLAMSSYFTWLAQLQSENTEKANQSDVNPLPHTFDDSSLVGKQYEENEGSTVALGRIVYQTMTNNKPLATETKTWMNFLRVCNTSNVRTSVVSRFGMSSGACNQAVRSKKVMNVGTTNQCGFRYLADGGTSGTQLYSYDCRNKSSHRRTTRGQLCRYCDLGSDTSRAPGQSSPGPLARSFAGDPWI